MVSACGFERWARSRDIVSACGFQRWARSRDIVSACGMTDVRSDGTSENATATSENSTATSGNSTARSGGTPENIADPRLRAYETEAVVLRTYKLGEADRIVVVLTQDHGKVRAVAKGVRKTRSKFGSRLEPASHVRVQLYRGRGDLDTVTGVESASDLSSIRSDLDRLTAAAGMLEAVDYITPDKESNPVVFKMLVGALGVVADTNPPLALAGFFWKLLAAEGYHPVLNRCVGCGGTPGDGSVLVSLDFDDGGMRCVECRRGRSVSADTLDMMRLMLGGHLNVALELPASPAASEALSLSIHAVEFHLERALRSVRVLSD